jgi:hypothetical protein
VNAVPGRPDIAQRPDTSDHPDISDRPDITGLVTEFYRRAFADEVLGPIFVDVARVDPSAHLPVMGDFWDTACRCISPQRPPASSRAGRRGRAHRRSFRALAGAVDGDRR